MENHICISNKLHNLIIKLSLLPWDALKSSSACTQIPFISRLAVKLSCVGIQLHDRFSMNLIREMHCGIEIIHNIYIQIAQSRMEQAVPPPPPVVTLCLIEYGKACSSTSVHWDSINYWLHQSWKIIDCHLIQCKLQFTLPLFFNFSLWVQRVYNVRSNL